MLNGASIFRRALSAFILSAAVAGVVRGQDDAQAPLTVSASVNGSLDAVVEQGWPILLMVEIMHAGLAEDTIVPVVLSPGSGSWQDAVQLTVVDSQRNPVVWPFHPAYIHTGDLTVDTDSGGALAWWLTPEETSLLAPGTYQLIAAIDSSAVQPPFDALPPSVSVPVNITVATGGFGGQPSATVSAADPLLVAGYHVLRGDDSTALDVIDQLIAGDPANVGGLGYRGGILRGMGRTREALAAYEAAVITFFIAPPDTIEPPFELLREYYELQDAYASRKTFDVTVGTKMSAHPYYGSGHTDGFLIDDIQGAELWLHRDSTYTFRMVNIPAGTPFYFTTDTAGGGAEAYTDGVTGSPVSGNDEITITPGAGTPPLLYYHSTTQLMMGWRLHIVHDSIFTGVGSAPVTIPSEYELSLAYPNPFNPETRFTLTVRTQQRLTITLFDVSGRFVRTLYDGAIEAGLPQAFNVRGEGLATGVYLIQVRGERFATTRRIILLK